ncbi:hypothetical protein K402DRAFT_3162 [Aulographum hederae CBS 113979]|uniref:Uncharacterized protein n=1 Tax=Aulographum hederae CBS 113979 TaxID=1176131 RepID=A0A6G1HGS7_9PEZI|nr:hypothetical protein K402DRAFT_3162 [Aulographum hederae CBS 113979]
MSSLESRLGTPSINACSRLHLYLDINTMTILVPLHLVERFLSQNGSAAIHPLDASDHDTLPTPSMQEDNTQVDTLSAETPFGTTIWEPDSLFDQEHAPQGSDMRDYNYLQALSQLQPEQLEDMGQQREVTDVDGGLLLSSGLFKDTSTYQPVMFNSTSLMRRPPEFSMDHSLASSNYPSSFFANTQQTENTGFSPSVPQHSGHSVPSTAQFPGYESSSRVPYNSEQIYSTASLPPTINSHFLSQASQSHFPNVPFNNYRLAQHENAAGAE